jgi:hypothetical protein
MLGKTHPIALAAVAVFRSTDPRLSIHRSVELAEIQSLENGAGLADFMGAKEISSAERSEHRKEGFSRAHFLFKTFESVRQSMTGWDTERTETKGVNENLDLVTNPRR